MVFLNYNNQFDLHLSSIFTYKHNWAEKNEQTEKELGRCWIRTRICYREGEKTTWGTTLSCLIFPRTSVYILNSSPPPSSLPPTSPCTKSPNCPSPTSPSKTSTNPPNRNCISPFKEHQLVSFRLHSTPGDVLLRRQRPRLHQHGTCLRNRLWQFCWRHNNNAAMRLTRQWLRQWRPWRTSWTSYASWPMLNWRRETETELGWKEFDRWRCRRRDPNKWIEWGECDSDGTHRRIGSSIGRGSRGKWGLINWQWSRLWER